ncbi:hypothetical protein ASPSYDRAFT_52618 [Aspergillus sydowii CBS 593.65]|uniref:Uncharacterized protein n=1 Tax=Aspergillus sydowii CBS 593.65 TaxID=1036612 RepID=A0A1L9SXX2_9EURO|nr:uncharacterized protein ASPSYDRAFT_52618 [Aspergillus sydowii CBS 593.65]OJJ51996.1 hypothetical protein ASPSYDRAFT_52618 [Aspergillus sydowii CBS 593.65]
MVLGFKGTIERCPPTAFFPLTFSNDSPHRTRPKSILNNLGLCRNVHENAFCASVYPLDRLAHWHRTVSSRFTNAW